MPPIRVLIVDDKEGVRRDLRMVLSLAGEIQVIGEAADGLEGIRMAESLKPDVILMDLEMPVLNGYEAAHQIKALLPASRVVALTIHAYESAREKARRAGMDDFIVKGAPVETLVQAISKRKE